MEVFFCLQWKELIYSRELFPKLNLELSSHQIPTIMNNIRLGIILLSAFCAVAGRAQNDPSQWVSYLNSENIQGITEDAADMWLATTAGLVKYTRSTGATQVYT
jgi:hypothetical protein